MNQENTKAQTTIYELVSRVTKEVDENKVNKMLKEGWVLLTVGNMYQVANVREGKEVKVAIGQTPYYVLGKLRGR